MYIEKRANGRVTIELTGNTAKRFNELAKHPSVEAAQKRDRYLKEISETLEITQNGSSVCLSAKKKTK